MLGSVLAHGSIVRNLRSLRMVRPSIALAQSLAITPFPFKALARVLNELPKALPLVPGRAQP